MPGFDVLSSPRGACDRDMGASHKQHNDVYEEQTDEDEGEVDEELLEVALRLRVDLYIGRSADGGACHVLHSLHSPSVWRALLVDAAGSRAPTSGDGRPVEERQVNSEEVMLSWW